MKQKYKGILKQVQNDEVRDCHAIARNDGESGRSMVEMLGVLAVIGVLSVAGIAGYSIAMRSYRTNEIVNAASMLYVMAMAKNQGNGADTNYTELGTPPSGATLAYSASDKSITVTFTDPNDCTMALNKLGDKASANTCSANPATITVNFGEVPAYVPWNSEAEDFDHACPDGYIFVYAPTNICAKTESDVEKYCIQQNEDHPEFTITGYHMETEHYATCTGSYFSKVFFLS